MQTPPKHCDPIPCTANPSLALNTIREASPQKNQNVNFFQIGLDPPTQGSEKWIAQIQALLDKVLSFGPIRFGKYSKIRPNTYNLDNVKQFFF